MYWENLVFDATDPQSLGRFWEAALGCVRLSDSPEGFETRLAVDGGQVLDLCFQRVPENPSEPVRLHLDLRGGDRQDEIVDRLLGLGASHLDIGQGDVPWVVLADPEGNPFCVMEDRPAYAGAGPIAAIPIDSADPDRDAAFWSWLTGWEPVAGSASQTLRNPSGPGALLEFLPEREAKPAAKNRLHLDVRAEVGDDVEAVVAGIVQRGGRELHPDWGELPWRVFADPSGNEFCVLPAREAA